MKRISALILFSSYILSTPLFAVNMAEGFYGSIFGEISHGPSNDDIAFVEDRQVFRGQVKFSGVGGGGLLTLGYRYRQFRAEGEFLYNRFSTGPVTVGTCTIENVNVPSPTGTCTPGVYNGFLAKGLGFSGSSVAMYGLINGIFDFALFDEYDHIVPYIGAGIGAVSIKNGSSSINTVQPTSHGYTPVSHSSAYQGILGLSYYMDDFTWAAMDFRYIGATRKELTHPDVGVTLPNHQYNLATLNFGFGFSFDRS